SLDDENAPETPDNAPAVDAVLSNAEEDEHLRAAVLRLPGDLRFTVTAHFWGGLAVKEIAAIEEITTVAIRKRLHKAFSLLEQALGGNVEEERQ
ncbi:MAG: RNA polymerase sigma factor, partial [Thermoanaerobaculia bacterium]